jgi:hypothetical protein
MPRTARIVRALSIAVLACSFEASVAWTSDRWEFGSQYHDSDADTKNELVHPTFQAAHDLEGQDQDWYVTQTRAGHSYEARVRSSTIAWGPFLRFDRVDTAGVVITAGEGDGAPVGGGGLLHATLTVRWTAAADATEYLRATGGVFTLGPQDQYDLEFADTTYFAPRFNNSSSQITILIVQNTTSSPITGSILFHSAVGTLLGASPLSLAANGTQVLNTSTIPSLSGQSGSIAISHLGSYGALTGKAVAVEPATGFTFDTTLTPLPR